MESLLVVGNVVAFEYHEKQRLGTIEKIGTSKAGSDYIIVRINDEEVKTFTVAKISKLERIMA